MKTRLAMVLIWVLCALAAAVGLVWMALAILTGSPRALDIAVGFDQMANATFGGDEDETISSRCWRYREEQPYRTLRRLIDAAFGLAGEKNHCLSAYLAERVAPYRAHGGPKPYSVPELRGEQK